MITNYFDRTAFEKHGFQIVRNALSSEVHKKIELFLKQKIQDALLDIQMHLPHSDQKDLVRKINNGVSTGNLPSGNKQLDLLLSGHFPLDVRLSNVLWEIARCKRFSNLLNDIFPGESHRMHMPPAARFVLPGNSIAGVPTHQDLSYNKHMSDFVTIWVPFCKIDQNCGGVAVDKSGPKKEVHAKQHGFWLEELQSNDDFEHCIVPLGGALIISPYLLHRSMPNISDRIRISIDYRFFGSSSKSAKHYLDLNNFEVFDGSGVNAQ